ncbi:MAG TPA: hypothetical protein VFD70_00405 [Anaerolineae bacterium]|nr:hypothetical protein [Anaerolineae bacterium]
MSRMQDAQKKGAPRESARMAAKGQSERAMSRTPNAATPTPSKATMHDDWARECLFDCYNG